MKDIPPSPTNQHGTTARDNRTTFYQTTCSDDHIMTSSSYTNDMKISFHDSHPSHASSSVGDDVSGQKEPRPEVAHKGGTPTSFVTMSSHTLEAHELTLRENPVETLQTFLWAVYGAIPKEWPFSFTTTLSFSVAVIASSSLHILGKNGTFDYAESSMTIRDLCYWLEAAVLETLFWFVCGVLSTIGLGSGIQTGALFLFPHVCRLALAWSKEQQQGDVSPSLLALLWSVAIPGFWSGSGSAVGELVPFLLARVIRQSGKDPFDLLNLEGSSIPKSFDKDETTTTASTQYSVGSHDSLASADSIADHDSIAEESSSTWTPRLLLSNTRVAMESQLSTNTFWKIFTLAVVPNALFDLAGLVCGASSDVTCWQFFSATWLAKALIRTPGQTCGLALAVVAIASPTSLGIMDGPKSVDSLLAQRQDLTRAAAAASSSTTNAVSDFFERWGRMALAEFVGDDEFLPESHHHRHALTGDNIVGEGEKTMELSIVFVVIKALWSFMTVAMLVFFLASTVEQVAQHYHRTKMAPITCGTSALDTTVTDKDVNQEKQVTCDDKTG